MIKQRYLPASLLVTIVSATLAAEPPEIVVTATRTPISVTELPASSTVITREDIERQQARTLPEVLQGVAGVSLTESGGFGKTASVFLRGTESDHVLVLINGIRVGSASLGLTLFELLPVEQIERVEVIRGPRASQWGSEAIGGVIQIFTRAGHEQTAYYATAGAGSFATFSAAAGLAGATGMTRYSVDASHFDSRGFDARKPVPGPFGFDQPDDDGYDNTSVHARIRHRFAEAAEMDTFVLRATGTTEFDGSIEDETDFVQQIAGVSLMLSPADFWDLRFRLGESRDESDNFSPDGVFSSRFDTRRREAQMQSDFKLAEHHVLTAGIDYRNDDVDSTSAFTETSRDNLGVYAQYVTELQRHRIHASLRYDDNQAFGSETTGGFGWGHAWETGIRTYVSYGQAFKTPSFNELFFPNFGNPNLDPETSESLEVGVEAQQQWGEWSARVYRTNIDDLIVTVLDPASGSFLPDNVDRARIDGIEIELSTELALWEINAALDLLDPEDRNSGRRLRRRADTSASIEFSREIDQWRMGGRLLAQGDRFEDAENRNRLSGYATLDVYAEYRPRQDIVLRLKIGNLFDKDYETVDGFNSPDRNFLVSLKYSR